MVMSIQLKRIPSILAFSLIFSAACTMPGDVQARDLSQNLTEVATEDTQYKDIRILKVAENLENPWAVAFLPDGRYLVTERRGRLNLIDNGQVTQISGVPEVSDRGQGGLLDVVLHPNFTQNGWVYLTYSKPNGNGETATALARGRLNGNALEDVTDIFVQNRYSQPGRHYGSRLAWTNDGKLLMTIGDRGVEPPPRPRSRRSCWNPTAPE